MAWTAKYQEQPPSLVGNLTDEQISRWLFADDHLFYLKSLCLEGTADYAHTANTCNTYNWMANVFDRDRLRDARKRAVVGPQLEKPVVVDKEKRYHDELDLGDRPVMKRSFIFHGSQNVGNGREFTFYPAPSDEAMGESLILTVNDKSIQLIEGEHYELTIEPKGTPQLIF
jgi:hypothetical protein